MLNINGFTKVTKIEKEGKFTKATLYYGRKRQDDDYDNTFINAIFVGKAHEKMDDVEAKDEIYIENGILENISYVNKQKENKQFLKVTVFDIVVDEDEIITIKEAIIPGFKTEKKKKGYARK